MTNPQIERVDAIPILVTWLQHMAVAEHIDSHCPPPIGNGTGCALGNWPCSS